MKSAFADADQDVRRIVMSRQLLLVAMLVVVAQQADADADAAESTI